MFFSLEEKLDSVEVEFPEYDQAIVDRITYIATSMFQKPPNRLIDRDDMSLLNDTFQSTIEQEFNVPYYLVPNLKYAFCKQDIFLFVGEITFLLKRIGFDQDRLKRGYT